MNVQSNVLGKDSVAASKKTKTMPVISASDQKKMLHKMFAFCCLGAPLLLAIASFNPGIDSNAASEYFTKFTLGVAPVLGIYAIILFIGVIIAYSNILLPYKPKVALIACVLGIAGAVGGTNFLTTFSDMSAMMILGVKKELVLKIDEVLGVSGLLVKHLIGILFPLSFVLFGIVLARTKLIPLWCGVAVSLFGITFPLGRIPHIVLIMHLTDLLALISIPWIGIRFLRGDFLDPTEVQK